MSDSVYKIIELVGTSETSWEDAAKNAVKEASETVRDISGLRVLNQTATVKDGAITEYRANVPIPGRTAMGLWDRINLVNLLENILPTRQRANLILRKGADHAIRQVALRKL